MPIGFYLCGAAGVTTFDLHAYLKPRLVMQTLDAIRQHHAEIRGYFTPVCGGSALDSRLDALCASTSFSQLMRVTGIEYRAPADAAATGLDPGSIDIQISYTVFEHIPGPVLTAILREAGRILAPGGVALHHIDPSDHFWHEDASISPIHFLQFSEAQWKRYGDNQFAYHNRLRASQFRAIYDESAHEILQWTPNVDKASLALLDNGFPLDAAFRGMTRENLSTTVLHVLSRPKR
jgi:SAM-dependent methyltransferase